MEQCQELGLWVPGNLKAHFASVSSAVKWGYSTIVRIECGCLVKRFPLLLHCGGQIKAQEARPPGRVS